MPLRHACEAGNGSGASIRIGLAPTQPERLCEAPAKPQRPLASFPQVADVHSDTRFVGSHPMPSIHFICRGSLNVHVVKHPVYESGVWDVENDAAQLVGGMMFLHEKKADRSYFGGRIESYRVVETDYARSRR